MSLYNSMRTRTLVSIALGCALISSIGILVFSALTMDKSIQLVAKKESASSAVVGLGDSTMALNSRNIADWAYGCRHEYGTWFNIKYPQGTNLSCAGGATAKITSIAEQSDVLGAKTRTVYITIGSNDVKYGLTDQQRVTDIKKLITTVQRKAPQANIIFVGYLPVPQGACLSPSDNEAAARIDGRHLRADETMQEMGQIYHARFIPMRQAQYDICSPESFIAIPGASSWTWHTTNAGHAYIVNRI